MLHQPANEFNSLHLYNFKTYSLYPGYCLLLLFTLYVLLDAGYMSDDCSVQQGQVPQVKNLTSATCDVRAETADDMPCRAVQLQAIGISSGSLTCKITVSIGRK